MRRNRRIPKGQRELTVVAMPRARKVARAVLIRAHPYGRLGASAKELARDSGYPLRTVYRSVHRLLESGDLTKTEAGFASTAVFHDLTADPTALLRFQNLKFVVENWQTTPEPPCRSAWKWIVKDMGAAGFADVAETSWEGRRLRFTYYPRTGTLEGIVGAVVPIPYQMAGALYGWLQGLLGLGRGETSRVTFLEVNADHRHVRLEQNYVELRDLPGISQVIYQKLDALRHENRVSDPRGTDGKPIPLERAMALLVEGSPEARMERLLKMEIELAQKQLELQRATENVPAGTASVRREAGKVTPEQAAREGFYLAWKEPRSSLVISPRSSWRGSRRF